MHHLNKAMPTEAELRFHRCCFTGHRPEKLNCPEDRVKAMIIPNQRLWKEHSAADGKDAARFNNFIELLNDTCETKKDWGWY